MQDRFPPPRQPVVDRVAFLIEVCRGKSVLHLGCTDWPITERKRAAGLLLHERLAAVARSLTGVDCDEAGVECLRRMGYTDTHLDDVEEFTNPGVNQRQYEVIVAGEIIEHLENPGNFLRAAQRLMNAESRLVITTVNAYCLFRFLRYLAGKEMVHEDHNFYFSPRVLQKLVTRCGLVVEAFRYYAIGRELRAHIPKHFLWIDDFSRMFFPAASDGVIVVARLPRLAESGG